MKYMFLMYSPESAWTPEEWNACTQKSADICRELAVQQKFEAASPLHPVHTAITIRIRNGQRQLTTGPFAETVEQLGGYYILDLANLDEAIAIASRLPPVAKGTVEIRPIRITETRSSGRKPDDVIGNMTRYMFLCYQDGQYCNDSDSSTNDSMVHQSTKFANQLNETGQLLAASQLYPVTTATSVRVRNGKRSITDGPFSETRELLGGYYLVQAKSSAEAIEIAAECPTALFGAIEVRQVFALTDLPT